MAKQTKRHKKNGAPVSRRTRMVLLPVFIAIGFGAVVLTALSIIVLPKLNEGTQYGIGADGFRAYVEDDSDLGVASITNRDSVVKALGNKAKTVGTTEVSKVFNFNGDRSQTVTYPFVRADGNAANLYIDMKLYQNLRTQEKDNIYAATADAGKINGHPAYYKMAQTIDGDREYHLMVVNGLKAYRFVIAQPAKNVTITEVGAVAALKRLALDSKL